MRLRKTGATDNGAESGPGACCGRVADGRAGVCGSASFPKGALAKLPGGCNLGLSFDLPDSVGEGFDAIMGDRELSSADALAKKAEPTVGRIQLGYPAP
jgi:hypothetical protein